MGSTGGSRRGSLTHSLLSLSAAALFLLAGVIGYDGLMGTTGLKVLSARVMSVRPVSGGERGGNHRQPSKPVALLLQVAIDPIPAAPSSAWAAESRESAPRDGGPPKSASAGDPRVVTVWLKPIWDHPWLFQVLAANYPVGKAVRIRPQAGEAISYELAGLSPGWLTLLPILLSCLGVLCLAASLQYAPERLQRDGSEGDLPAAPGSRR